MRGPVSLPLYLLVVITMLVSSLPPAAMAQPAPNPCPEGQVYLPDQKVCVPEDQAPPDDGSEQPEEPAEPEQPAEPAGDLASFTLYHLACDNDFDPNGVRDAGGLGPTNGCLTYGKPAFTYTISANGTVIITSTIEAVERDFARFDVPGPIPAGSLTISVAPVTDYTTEFMSCGLSIGEGPTDVIEPPIAGGVGTLNTLPDQDVECWVYNVTRAPESTGADTTITSAGGSVNMSFLSVACPVDAVIGADIDRICTDGLANVTYEILSETETLARNATDGNGVLIFENVPDGLLAIVESVPAGYGEPYVLCTHYSPTNGDREYAPAIEYGTGFMASVAPGDDLNCTWYNFPAAGPDNGPNIFIEARTCNPGTSISASMNVFDAQALCPFFYVDLAFQVLNVDQVIATARTNAEQFSAGRVYFTKLPEPESGSFGVTAGVREGERTLAVFCDQDFGDGTFQIIPVRVSGDRMDQELGMGAGDTLRCTWFIEMNPLMLGTHAPDAPAQEAAPPEAGDETEPDVTGEQDAPGADQTLVTSQEGQASPAANAGEDDAGSELSGEVGLTVQTLLCPPEVAGSDEMLDERCTEPASGLTFEILVDDESTGTYVTDANGELDIPDEAGAGMYLFRHDPAAGLLEVRTDCASVYPNGATARGQSSATGSEMGEIYFAYDDASLVTCTFYFVMDTAEPAVSDAAEAPETVPAEEAAEDEDGATDGSHSFTLQFLTCPDGIDPAADQAALEQACSVETGQRSFMLTIDGFTTGETITGPTTWEFHDSTVYADVGTGPITSVWCDSSWAEVEGGGDAADVPDTVLLEGGALTVTVTHPATTVSCDWFIFPG